MAQKQATEHFEFESREAFDEAQKELELIQELMKQMDVSKPKMALKLYNKAVSEKIFGTVNGYFFLMELRQHILESGVATDKVLAPIPIKAPKGVRKDTITPRPPQEGRFQRLYEGQCLLNKKFKIAIVAMVITLIGFVAINFRFEYTIFTYFTNYKANMEEEIIDKYEKWEEELKAREDKLSSQDGAE